MSKEMERIARASNAVSTPKTAFDRLMGRSLTKEVWTSKHESRTPSFLRVLDQASKGSVARIFTGEVSPRFWEQDDVIGAFRELIEKGGQIQIVFSKHDSGDEAEVRKYLELDNERLVALAREHPDVVELRWLPDRPAQHFLVVEDAVQVEEPGHGEGERPATMSRFRDEKWAGTWRKKFDKAWVEDAKPLDVS